MIYFIYYLSYLSFLLFFFLIYRIYKLSFKITKKEIFLFVLTLFFIYSRFIEPNIVLIKNEQIKIGFNANVVVLSDLHLGVYKDKFFLQKVVDKINTLQGIDFVLIPGDFAYVTTKNNDFVDLFSPFKNLKVPVFATLGNHDLSHPGPEIEKDLIIALEKYNVKLIENKSIKFNNINILGLGDNFAGTDDINLITKYKKDQNLIVLTHNPDTVMNYKKADIPDITIAGHSHGGQIRIPFIYKYVIPCKGEFDEGFYDYNQNKIFVSSGLGEVGLPMRLFIPPTIYFIKFY
ncbi:MAG: metallophosphoesterase [Candidatus Gracilibacteria bacterium]|nr:metallophosphoesterase [Candidatus Gracilibacteria bacterium]